MIFSSKKSNIYKRIISFFLIMVLVLINLVLPFPGNTAEAKTDTSQAKTKIKQEITSQRTRNSKSYLNEDGRTFTSQIYQGPIHYLDENKSWQEIDNELVETQKNGFKYENKANEFKLYFSELSGGKDFIRFQKGKNAIDISPVETKYVKKEFEKDKTKIKDKAIESQTVEKEDLEKKASQKPEKAKQVSAIKNIKSETDNKLNYEGIFSDVDFSYTVKESMLKEDITIHKYTDNNTFSFEVNTENLYLEKADNPNTILIKKEGTDKLIASFQAPFMKDSKNNISKNLALELRQENGKSYVDVIADEDWLKDEKRAYPVVIDPILYYFNSLPEDTYVRSGYMEDVNFNQYYTSYSLEAGCNKVTFDEELQYLFHTPFCVNDDCESYLKFNLPVLPSGARILYANFNALASDYYSWGYNQSLGNINLHRINSAWDDDQVTWNTKPAYGSVEAAAQLQGGQWGIYEFEDFWGNNYQLDTYQNGVYSVNITPLFRDWYQGTQPNYGLALTGDDNNTGVAIFHSSEEYSIAERPWLTVFYDLDSLGYANNWGFTDESTNVYNGNLLEQAVDMFVPGRGEPVNITRTYNSRSNREGLFGKGWTSNLEVRVEDVEGEAIFLYDANGTERVFLPWIGTLIDNSYISETTPGAATGGGAKQERIIKESNGTYTITQISGTKITFNSSGKIISITDKNNNLTTYNYNTGTGKLESISDPSGRAITFSYNANGNIEQATDPAGKTVHYTYDGNNRLVSCLDQENKILAYEYNADHNLTKITYPRGNYISYGYDDQDRATAVTRTITVNGTPTTATSVIAYDPANKRTTVTDANGRKIAYEYDDMGNLVKVAQDPDNLNYRTLINYNTDKDELESVANPNTVAAGGTVSYGLHYDEFGRVDSVTNPLNESTSIEYGGTNHTVSSGESTAQSVSDGNGNITHTIDGLKQGNTFAYDQYGNITRETDKLSGTDNLVTNSSFEEGFTNWDLAMQAGNSATKVISVSSYKFGKKSLEITNPSGWIEYTNNNSAFTYDPAKTYTLSGYIKTTNLSTNAAHLKIKCYNSSGSFLGEVKSPQLKTANDWTRLNLVLTPDQVPVGTAKIKPALAMDAASGTACFDGIQLEEGANQSAYNYLSNSSFERDANADGAPDDWTVFAPHEISQTGFSGNSSVRLINDGTYPDIYLSQHVNLFLSANSDLTLSGWSQAFLAEPNGGFYGLRAIVEYADSTTETFDFGSNKGVHAWEQIVGNIHLTKAASGITIKCKYDNQNGYVWFDSLRLQEGKNSTEIQYDPSGNYPLAVTNALGQSVGMQYDTSGNLTHVTDPAGKTTSFGYDDLGRMTNVTGVLGNNAQYTYDGNGNLTTATDPGNQTFTYGYNEIDAVASITDPLNNTKNFSYDKTGNLTGISYPSGNTINFAYNTVDRLEEVKYNGNPRYSYEYDPNGNCTGISDEETNQTTTYEYNKLDALINMIKPGQQLDYAYDNENGGRFTGLSGQIGSFNYNANYSYDDLGRVQKVTGNGISAEYLYDENNKVASIKLGDGSYTLYSYNDADLLKELVNYRPNGTILSRYTYTYDSRGNITDIIGSEGTLTYQYDDLSRLTRETLPDSTIIEYSYDAAGNRQTKTVTQGGTSQIVINQNQQSYEYDTLNRLQEVKNPDGTTQATFTYDALGRRSSMTSEGNTVNYQYSGSKVICETDANNNVLACYNYDGYGNLISMTRNGSTYYYHYNGHGDVIALTDTSGNTVATYQYDAFGNVLNSTGTVDNPYRYAGYRYDEATGLYYLNARYYDPETGRFTTADTFHGYAGDPQSLNLYAYCYNNPLAYVDPDGHDPCYCPRDPVQDDIKAIYDFLIGDDINTLLSPEASTGAKIIAGLSIGSYVVGGEVITKGLKLAGKGVKLALKAKKGMKVLEEAGEAADNIVIGSFGKNTVGAAENYIPKNIEMVKDKFLKKNGINAHALKEDFIGKKNIAHHDIYVDKDSGMLWIYKKGGKGEPIPTYEYIK